MLFMLFGVEIEEHCSTEDKPQQKKNLLRMIRHSQVGHAAGKNKF